MKLIYKSLLLLLLALGLSACTNTNAEPMPTQSNVNTIKVVNQSVAPKPKKPVKPMKEILPNPPLRQLNSNKKIMVYKNLNDVLQKK